jgi:biofilm PGA synthesis N-glycosyltransferase PgaC
MEITFWICVAFVLYTYAGYPLMLGLLARHRREPRRERFGGSVSFVVAVYNEEANLGRRLNELTGFLEAGEIPGEIIVVSDGSTDATATVARNFTRGHVRVVELLENQGKAAALSAGCAVAQNDILVFADARQTWASDALVRLLENFADSSIGAVSGDLIVESQPGVMAGVGLYWRFEKWLRLQEGRLHSTIGVTGAISAVRRELFRPIPPGTVLDDVYWPLRVVLQGYRNIHDGRAHAYDRLPEKTGDEFRRKVRTLAGNLQLLARLPGLMVPWRNPVWWQWLSHKLFRLLAPWALLAMLVLSAILPGAFYALAFWAQATLYLIGLSSIKPIGGKPTPLAAVAGSFLVLNAAAWVAFWTWISGRAGRSWKKVDYVPKPLKTNVLTTIE